MITIFTIPKSFSDKHINTIQTNAIKSWKSLKPKCQILLIGDDPGVKETAHKLKVEHFPEVKVNSSNTPILSSAFKIARENAIYETLLYVNADIILLKDILKLQRNLPPNNYLIVGERYDLDIRNRIDFSNPKWDLKLKDLLMNKGKKHPRYGSDYFMFNITGFKILPDFAVGRVGWDNWMIGEALSKNMMVIDASPVNTIIHQNHNYLHQNNRGGSKYSSKEALTNKKLGEGKLKWLESTNYLFTNKGIRKKTINLELILNNSKRFLSKIKKSL